MGNACTGGGGVTIAPDPGKTPIKAGTGGSGAGATATNGNGGGNGATGSGAGGSSAANGGVAPIVNSLTGTGTTPTAIVAGSTNAANSNGTPPAAAGGGTPSGDGKAIVTVPAPLDPSDVLNPLPRSDTKTDTKSAAAGTGTGAGETKRNASSVGTLPPVPGATPAPSATASPLLVAPTSLVPLKPGYLPLPPLPPLAPEWKRKFNPADETDFSDFMVRNRKFQTELQEYYAKAPKLEKQKLPEGVQYIRPFLSSTFRDFNEERNIAINVAFPRLEKLCNDRGVFFCPLDLRWGVTSEQSGSGQVIKICLEEINQSKPYFVCSLGFRNGWALSPLDDPNDSGVQLLLKTFGIAIEAFPWIKDKLDRSVTEIEILHGALNQVSPRAFFYFRDVNYLTTLKSTDRPAYIEMGVAEQRIQNLKRAIVEKGYRVRFFKTPQENAEMIEEDLRQSIEEDFPPQKYNALERELRDHKGFAEMRTRVHVGAAAYRKMLDEYVFGKDTPENNKPIVVCGTSGCGKSALLANWVFGLKKQLKEGKLPFGGAGGAGDLNWNQALIEDRYIGATSDSTIPFTLVRTLLQEIKEKYKTIDRQIPSDPKKLFEEFGGENGWLDDATHEAPLLVVLDGLNQLVDDNEAHLLGWLPRTFPRNMRIVVSTISGSKTHLALRERDFRQCEVQPLSDDQRLDMITQTLGHYGKTLDVEQKQRIVKHENTRNPLYLHTFLSEVRVFGSYESLNGRIDHYMSSATIAEMFNKVIARLEDDFNGKSCPDLVRNTLSVMECSRRGLGELEMKGCLSLALGMPLGATTFPNLELSALMLRLHQSLVDQRGLRKFSHAYLREAVSDRYFKKDQVLKTHQLLATHFRSAPLSARKVEEYPYHLYKCCSIRETDLSQDISDAKELHELMECLTDLDMFEIFNLGDFRFDLHRYWQFIEDQFPEKKDIVARSYEQPLEKLQKEKKIPVLQLAEKYEDVATFLINTDRYNGTDYYLTKALEIRREKQGPDHEDVEVLLTKRGNLYHRQGKFEQALPLFQSALAIVTKSEGQLAAKTANGKTADVQVDAKSRERSAMIRTSIAGILKELGRYKESLPLYEQSLRDKVALYKGYKHYQVAISMSNFAELYLRMQQPEKAIIFYEDARKVMEVTRGLSHPEVATVLINLAGCHVQLKHLREAISLYERAKKIKEDLYGVGHISMAVVLNGLGTAYLKLGSDSDVSEKERTASLDTALRLFERSLAIRKTAHGQDSPHLAPILSNIGNLYKLMNKSATAIQYLTQALSIMKKSLGRQHPDITQYIRVLANVHALPKVHKYKEALELYLMEHEILIKVHNSSHRNLLPVLNDIARMYTHLNKWDQAITYHVMELKIQETEFDPNHVTVSDTLVALSDVYLRAAKPKEAYEAASRALAIREKQYGVDSPEAKDARDLQSEAKDDADLTDGGSGGAVAGGPLSPRFGADTKSHNRDTKSSGGRSNGAAPSAAVAADDDDEIAIASVNMKHHTNSSLTGLNSIGGGRAGGMNPALIQSAPNGMNIVLMRQQIAAASAAANAGGGGGGGGATGSLLAHNRTNSGDSKSIAHSKSDSITSSSDIGLTSLGGTTPHVSLPSHALKLPPLSLAPGKKGGTLPAIKFATPVKAAPPPAQTASPAP